MLKYKMNIQEALKEAGYSTYRLRQEKLLPESTVLSSAPGKASAGEHSTKAPQREYYDHAGEPGRDL